MARTGYDGHFGPTTYESSVDRFASADLVVHRWDLGTGAGVEVVLDDRDVAASLEDLDALEEPMRSMMRGPGAFGPEIEVADDADDQTRLLAFLGRRSG
ncbi:MAG: hypothetical protein R2702_10720 [Acidimicrobiales bacterium]